jgi:hypothetical protein
MLSKWVADTLPASSSSRLREWETTAEAVALLSRVVQEVWSVDGAAGWLEPTP